jgi:RND family efflux transporter MFP subunit
MDGVVTERPLYAGEMAGPGTVMLTIIDISRVVARANVPGEFIKFLKAGASATIASADGSSELPGKVTVISSALDPNSTTAEVWVEAANPGEQGKPGSSVQVSIVAETIADAIVIPLAAILPPEEGATTVMVAGSDSLAHRRTIETGIREGDKVQVVKGLEPGEQVIVVGALGLEDKAKVRIEKPGAKAEEKADDKTDTKTEKKPDGKTNQHD